MPDIFVNPDTSSSTARPKHMTAHPSTATSGSTSTAQAEHSSHKSHVKHRTVDDYSEVMRQESPTRSVFTAYAPKPVKVKFDSQGKEEQVVLLLRRHLITQVGWVVMAVFMVFLPFILAATFPVVTLLPTAYQMAVWLGWYGLVFSFVLESVLMWFYNVYIITDERVIDVDFHSLIYKNIASAKLDNIEDITATTGGALRSVFDFGTIKIQTAAADTEFEFEDVPHPARVTSLLNEMLIEEEREKLEGRVS